MAGSRLQNAAELLPDEADGALITSSYGRQYLLHFHSTAGVLLLTRRKAMFFVDSRYIERAQKEIENCEVHLLTSASKQLPEAAQQLGIKHLVVESSYMTMREFSYYQKLFSGVELLSSNVFDTALLKMRSVKAPDELVAMKNAQRITDLAFAEICNYIRVGVTEKQIAARLEYEMKYLGADGFAFDTIVVSGKNSSMPHGVPAEKPVETGDFITMDFGALKDGYCSDMTRTVAVGAVSEEQKRVYSTVLEAQKRALNAIAPGAVCNKIDAVARDYIDSAGYAGCFGHGLGHSLGIEIHESPAYNLSDQTKLLPGMVLSVEPGIYLPGKFGVRIEDVAVITDDGYENLTHSPKELIEL